jgi:undecaprenyl-diphosphatase
MGTIILESMGGHMDVVLVVLLAAAVGGLVAGVLAWRLPNFDPAAPRVPVREVAHEVQEHRRLALFIRSRLDTEVLTGLALTIALLVVLAGLVAVGSLLVMIQHNAGLAHYDLSAARWGATHATTGSTTFLRKVSLLGGTVGMLVVAVAVSVVEYIRRRALAVFGFMTLVVAGQVIVTNVTKVVVDRSRPNIHRLTGFSGASFPSGHAATAAATFAAAAFLLGRGRSQQVKAFLAALAAGIAVGVATTRVLLGVHWLTDVIAGLMMGWAWFAVSSIAFGGRMLQFGQPVKIAEEVVAHPPNATTTQRYPVDQRKQ